MSILSGPSFSNEVSQNLPTAITLATSKKINFNQISNLISDKNFRMYYSNDLIGTQLGGALKNIYAIENMPLLYKFKIFRVFDQFKI